MNQRHCTNRTESRFDELIPALSEVYHMIGSQEWNLFLRPLIIYVLQALRRAFSRFPVTAAAY